MTTIIILLTFTVILVSCIGIFDYALLIAFRNKKISWKEFLWFANPFSYGKAVIRVFFK
jgi:hypothetical protein